MSGTVTIHKIDQNKRKKDVQQKKQERLQDYLNACKGKKFTGYIKVNFSQGDIGRIEKFEEILK